MIHVTEKDQFNKKALSIHNTHRKQTIIDVDSLNKKYTTNNIFKSPINIWNGIEKLGFITDPTDKELYAVSQLTHVMQVIEGMEIDKIDDKNIYICGLLHDLGKLLLLTDENPSNIVCDNHIIQGRQNIGLDNCVLQWNHDEYIYIKLKNKIEYKYLWLMRYHSINIKSCEQYFDQKDKSLVEEMLIPFKKYDKGTKSIYHIPNIDVDKYRKIIENAFPEPLLL